MGKLTPEDLFILKEEKHAFVSIQVSFLKKEIVSILLLLKLLWMVDLMTLNSGALNVLEDPQNLSKEQVHLVNLLPIMVVLVSLYFWTNVMVEAEIILIILLLRSMLLFLLLLELLSSLLSSLVVRLLLNKRFV